MRPLIPEKPMPPSVDWHLERYRPLLCVLAGQFHLDVRLRPRIDSSDLVQETLLKAHQHIDQFQGGTVAKLVVWLKRILNNTLADKIRKATAQQCDVGREQSMQAALVESDARLNIFLTGKEPSPSQQLERQELLQRVGEALDQLPKDERFVVEQRVLFGAPVSQIAEDLGRTEKAVAGLLLRGRRKLRALLKEYQASPSIS
jgi:RNA polymerase sigma-70 factor (ECF subfamily)